MTTAIRPPFFEIGPKTYLDRKSLLELADAAAAASEDYDVDLIITPPALDIEATKLAAPKLWVFAQAMDIARPGASTGAILPEALAAAGADGVMLNHGERPLDELALRYAVERAGEAGLMVLVCANDISEARRYAAWSPELILLEPHELIGTVDGTRPPIARANAEIAEVNPDVLVMHSGGVANEHDARAIIADGAAGTGCTTAIVRAADRSEATSRMVRAVREGWDSRDQLVAALSGGGDAQ